MFNVANISQHVKISTVQAGLGVGGGTVETRTGGRIDMTKLIVTFGNFANAPKK